METKYESVCVIMSTYNGEKYFEEQIGSVLKQKKLMCMFTLETMVQIKI